MARVDVALHASDLDPASSTTCGPRPCPIQPYGPGLDAFGLNLLGNELAAWLIEREAARIVDAVEVEPLSEVIRRPKSRQHGRPPPELGEAESQAAPRAPRQDRGGRGRGGSTINAEPTRPTR